MKTLIKFPSLSSWTSFSSPSSLVTLIYIGITFPKICFHQIVKVFQLFCNRCSACARDIEYCDAVSEPSIAPPNNEGRAPDTNWARDCSSFRKGITRSEEHT